MSTFSPPSNICPLLLRIGQGNQSGNSHPAPLVPFNRRYSPGERPCNLRNSEEKNCSEGFPSSAAIPESIVRECSNRRHSPEFEVFIRRPPRLKFQQICIISGRQSQRSAPILRSRRVSVTQTSGNDPTIEQFSQAVQKRFVFVLAGNELVFIKTCAIVQQQFDVA